MAYENLIVERKHDDIVKMTLNRPDVLNALNGVLCSELRRALQEIQRDESIAVVLLTGAGRAFSAGLDMKDPTSLVERYDNLREVVSLLARLGPPVVAGVNGYAITGGFELALACDMIIASDTAVFRDTHAQAGIIPGCGNTQRLPRIVGEKKAKEILFTSDVITAAEAEKLGFVNRVVPPERLEEECFAVARKIACQPKHMVRELKRVVNDGMGMDFRAATAFEQSECLNLLKRLTGEEFTTRGRGVIDSGRALLGDGLP